MWKTIFDYDNYEMNIEGQVRNKTTGIIKKAQPDKDEYLRVGIYKDNKQKTFIIHRLIAIHFIPNPDNLPEVDHINGIRTDNRIENLRWVTRQQNAWNTRAKGYNITPYGKYQAKLYFNGKETHIGCYDTPEEARQAYLNKAQELRAGFIRQN